MTVVLRQAVFYSDGVVLSKEAQLDSQPQAERIRNIIVRTCQEEGYIRTEGSTGSDDIVLELNSDAIFQTFFTLEIVPASVIAVVISILREN